MSLVPETYFNYYFNQIGSLRGGGLHYYPNYVNVSSYTETYNFNEVFKAKITGLDPDVNVDWSTALVKELLTFPNNVKLQIQVYCFRQTVAETVHTGIQGRVIATYEGNTVSLSGLTLSEFGGWWTGNGYYAYTPMAFAENVGITLYIQTSYPMSSVIEGVTQVESLDVFCAVPTLTINNEGSSKYIFNPNMSSNTLYNLEYGSDESKEFYYYGVETAAGDNDKPIFPLAIVKITDLEELLDSLKEINDEGLNDTEDITGKPRVDGDPAQDSDPSGTGGGNGNYTGGSGDGYSGYDNNSDPIDFPELPTNGALDSGAIHAHLVNNTLLTALFTELWNASLFDLNTFQKLLTEPLNALISLQCLPITPTSSGSPQIMLGNYETGVGAPQITQQYYSIDCGELTIKRYYGSAMDYSPYTKVEIFLPFIGIKQLKAEDVIGFTIAIQYNMDILTGDLTAQIKCGQSVLYKFTGNCKATIPISANINSQLTTLVKGAGTVLGVTAGGMAGAGTAAISAAINTSLSKSYVQRSGDISGSVGLLDHFLPYLIIHRPIQSLAKNFKTFKGYPSNITATLSTLTGYTEVEHIHLTGINATDTELTEIEKLLKSGVII